MPTDATRYLRITELNYHPASDGDAEYIEFKNISSGAGGVTLDLEGVTITKGPSNPFTFPAGMLLAPGEYLLVVRSLPQFTAAYPNADASKIVGEFTGGLNNAGEEIEVIDGLGNIIHAFTFEDGSDAESGWHPTTDGFGPSLVIVDENALITNWSQGSGWRPSYELGGSPGEDDCLVGDVNCDGAVNLHDLSIVQRNMGTVGSATRAMGDLSGDGAVSRTDVAILARQFGTNVPVAGASPARAGAAAAIVVAPAARDDLSRSIPLERRVSVAAERRRSVVRENRIPLSSDGVDLVLNPENEAASATLRARRASATVQRGQIVDREKLVDAAIRVN
jgi:hypothetical protein